jgi:hypothetical protein
MFGLQCFRLGSSLCIQRIKLGVGSELTAYTFNRNKSVGFEAISFPYKRTVLRIKAFRNLTYEETHLPSTTTGNQITI